MSHHSTNYSAKGKKSYSKNFDNFSLLSSKSNISRKDGNIKEYIMNIFNNYNANPFTSTQYNKNKKNLNKMMDDYENFVKNYFGDSIDILTQQRMKQILEEEDIYKKSQKRLIEQLKDNLIFEEFLKKSNRDIDFIDESINYEPPSQDEFPYSNENSLGYKVNNEIDYKNRLKEIDPNSSISSPEEKEVAVKRITDAYKDYKIKKKMKKIYIGFDSTKTHILRIYATEYDKDEKIKNLKIYIYFIQTQKYLTFEKSIKEFTHKDSISEKGLKKKINDIIAKLLVQRDESIRSDSVSEFQRDKQLKELLSASVSKKKKYEEDEKTIYEKEEIIFNHDKDSENQENEIKNKKDISISKIEKKDNSHFGDEDYNDF